eukprot:COSAG06_NODE_7769_length_2381_cov_1.753287_3_plen_99_part_00
MIVFKYIISHYHLILLWINLVFNLAFSAALVMRSRSGPSSAGGGGGWTEQREAEGRAAALVRCGATWQGEATRVCFAMPVYIIAKKRHHFTKTGSGHT